MSEFFKRQKTWISSAHQGFVRDGIHSNTLPAYALAAEKGADMIETDARMTRDGVLIAHHDPDVKGFDASGRPVTCRISETDFADLAGIYLIQGNTGSGSRIPTLDQTLSLSYFAGMCVNIDLKEGDAHAEQIARLVVKTGMRGRTVYATNGAGPETIHRILRIDPQARFIDTKKNYTPSALESVPDYPARCYIYTADFSEENIAEIRESGCMLATISLNADNALAAFRHHPDMAEYPHTSDFEQIDRRILSANRP